MNSSQTKITEKFKNQNILGSFNDNIQYRIKNYQTIMNCESGRTVGGSHGLF